MKDLRIRREQIDINSPHYIPPSEIKHKVMDLLDQLSISYSAQAHLARRVYAKREAEIKAELCSGLIKMIDRLID